VTVEEDGRGGKKKRGNESCDSFFLGGNSPLFFFARKPKKTEKIRLKEWEKAERQVRIGGRFA